jgi:hypothetical protein
MKAPKRVRLIGVTGLMPAMRMSADVGKKARVITIVVIVVASFALLLAAAREAIVNADQSFRRDSLHAAEAVFDTYRCVQAKIDREIPSGASIAIRSSDIHWRQRSREGSYPRYQVTTARHAAYLVTITARGPTCEGVDVAIRRVRR